MKTFKFRYRDADGHYMYKELTLPDDAALNAFTYTKYSPPHRPCRLRKFNCVRKDDKYEGR